jgi:N utilization substance protein A
MSKDLVAIFEYLEKEKGIKRALVIEAIREALVVAAQKSLEEVGEVDVHIDSKTGEIEVVTYKTIVQKVEDSVFEISLEEALSLEPNCEVGQCLEIVITPQDFGRIAAQTARQVITQKLRNAEREVIYEEYRHRKNELISGTIKRFVRGNNIIVDLGKVEAFLPERNYPKGEHFSVGEKLQALLLDVRDTDNGGAEVVLSRCAPRFVVELFKQEVPELADKTVMIQKIVREPGYRTKMAVQSFDSKVDPVGTCVGVRGTRIKNIIRELNNEKIDVIPYTEDSVQLLQNAISPIEIMKLKESDDKVSIVVADDDYPVVLGKKGWNARLISQMIEKELEVQKISEYQKNITLRMEEISCAEDPELDVALQKISGVSPLIIEACKSAGFSTLRQIVGTSPYELTAAVPGFNYFDIAEKILEHLQRRKD